MNINGPAKQRRDAAGVHRVVNYGNLLCSLVVVVASILMSMYILSPKGVAEFSDPARLEHIALTGGSKGVQLAANGYKYVLDGTSRMKRLALPSPMANFSIPVLGAAGMMDASRAITAFFGRGVALPTSSSSSDTSRKASSLSDVCRAVFLRRRWEHHEAASTVRSNNNNNMPPATLNVLLLCSSTNCVEPFLFRAFMATTRGLATTPMALFTLLYGDADIGKLVSRELRSNGVWVPSSTMDAANDGDAVLSLHGVAFASAEDPSHVVSSVPARCITRGISRRCEVHPNYGRLVEARQHATHCNASIELVRSGPLARMSSHDEDAWPHTPVLAFEATHFKRNSLSLATVPMELVYMHVSVDDSMAILTFFDGLVASLGNTTTTTSPTPRPPPRHIVIVLYASPLASEIRSRVARLGAHGYKTFTLAGNCKISQSEEEMSMRSCAAPYSLLASHRRIMDVEPMCTLLVTQDDADTLTAAMEVFATEKKGRMSTERFYEASSPSARKHGVQEGERHAEITDVLPHGTAASDSHRHDDTQGEGISLEYGGERLLAFLRGVLYYGVFFIPVGIGLFLFWNLRKQYCRGR